MLLLSLPSLFWLTSQKSPHYRWPWWWVWPPGCVQTIFGLDEPEFNKFWQSKGYFTLPQVILTPLQSWGVTTSHDPFISILTLCERGPTTGDWAQLLLWLNKCWGLRGSPRLPPLPVPKHQALSQMASLPHQAHWRHRRVLHILAWGWIRNLLYPLRQSPCWWWGSPGKFISSQCKLQKQSLRHISQAGDFCYKTFAATWNTMAFPKKTGYFILRLAWRAESG